MNETLLWILAFLILSPLVVYLCVKAGTLGYYKGKEASKQHSLRRLLKDLEEDHKNTTIGD